MCIVQAQALFEGYSRFIVVEGNLLRSITKGVLEISWVRMLTLTFKMEACCKTPCLQNMSKFRGIGVLCETLENDGKDTTSSTISVRKGNPIAHDASTFTFLVLVSCRIALIYTSTFLLLISCRVVLCRSIPTSHTPMS